MNPIYIKNITIEKVRHLQDIQIPVSDDSLKHLIITGKNGSGKTSLLDALAIYLNIITANNEATEAERRIMCYMEHIWNIKSGLDVTLSVPSEEIREFYEKGEFIVAYYRANRVFQTIIPKQVEKVELQTSYAIGTQPRQNLVKYLLDMKMTQALALSSGKKEKAQTIQTWFDKFEELIQRILGNSEIKLVFDEDTFLFQLKSQEKSLMILIHFLAGMKRFLILLLIS